MKQITVSDKAYEYISQRAEQCGLSVEVWLTRYIGSMKSRGQNALVNRNWLRREKQPKESNGVVASIKISPSEFRAPRTQVG